MIVIDRAKEYANDVIAGKELAPPEVRTQCEWFLRDIARSCDADFEYFLDEDALAVVEGLFKLMHFATGIGVVGQSVCDGLVNYQWFFFCNIFGWRFKADRLRYRYRDVTLFIPRKNAKTFNAAIIIIVLMLTEDEYSEFYSICLDRDLAAEVKKAISQILNASPDIMGKTGVPRFKIPKTLSGKVECLLTHSFYQPRTAIANSNNSIRPSAFIADEIGAFYDYSNITAMKSGQLSVRNPLMFKLTTAYAEDKSIMLDELDYLKKIYAGTEVDDRLFALLYYAPEDHLWDDIGLAMANPLRVEANYEEMRESRKKALAKPAERVEFLTKHLNHFMPTNAGESFVDIRKLRLCRAAESFNWRGRDVYLGLDLSQTTDNTAVAMVTMVDDIVYFKVFAFIPAGRIEEKNRTERTNYQRFIDEGDCFACGDEVISYKFVEDFIIGLPEKYGVNILSVGYDRYNCISTAGKLEEAGIETIEIKQHSSVLHPATKWLQEMILEKLIRYEDSKLLEINFQNARCVQDTNGNMYVSKKKSKGKVDMVVATINALYLLQQEVLYGSNFICQV